MNIHTLCERILSVFAFLVIFLVIYQQYYYLQEELKSLEAAKMLFVSDFCLEFNIKDYDKCIIYLDNDKVIK